MTVTIPAGIDDGRRISIPHQGDAGTNGGTPGDLIIVVHVKSDKSCTEKSRKQAKQ